MSRTFGLPSSPDSLRNHYVDGEFVATGRCFDNVSPIDGGVLAQVHEADAGLADRAVRSAQGAGRPLGTHDGRGAGPVAALRRRHRRATLRRIPGRRSGRHGPSDRAGAQARRLSRHRERSASWWVPQIVQPHRQSGKLRLLAITGERRSPNLPSVPTMKQAGCDEVVAGGWYGLFAPKRMPAEIVGRLDEAVAKALTAHELSKLLVEQDLRPACQDGRALAAFQQSEIDHALSHDWGAHQFRGGRLNALPLPLPLQPSRNTRIDKRDR